MQLKNKIMRRIYIISYLRTILAPLPLKIYASALILWSIGRQVWVSRVLENAPGTDVSSNLSFFASAVWHAEFLVQTLVLGLLVLGLWLIKDLFSTRRLSFYQNF